MSDDRVGDNAAVQREVATLLLSVLGADGFVLAGAGAIRAHALTDRPTEDVDLFGMPLTTAEQFAGVVERAEAALERAGFAAHRVRSFEQYARLHVATADGADLLDVDLGLNWRAEPPVRFEVGPVLAERDAVAGKLSAVYSRGEVRDFLDLDAIRRSGRYSDADLLALGREHDDGFDVTMFAGQLSRVAVFLPSEAARYGVCGDDFAAVQHRLTDWAHELRKATERTSGASRLGHRQAPGPEQPTPPPTSDYRPSGPGSFDNPSATRRGGRPGPDHRGRGL